MSPNSKDRLIYTLTGGIFIPLSYLIALCLLSLLFAGHEIPAAEWLAAPISWPLYIDDYVLPAIFGDSDYGFVLLLLPAANFVLYSLLTYAVIRWRQRMPRLR